MAVQREVARSEHSILGMQYKHFSKLAHDCGIVPYLIKESLLFK